MARRQVPLVTLQEFLTKCSEYEKAGNPAAGIMLCDQVLEAGATGRELVAALRYRAVFLLQANSGWSLEVVGHLKEALEAAQAFPSDQPAILLALVAAYANHGYHAQARTYADQYFDLASSTSEVEIRRYQPRIWFNLGYCYDTDEEFTLAVDAYLRARELAQQHPDWFNAGLPAHNLVQMYLELGRIEDAGIMLGEAHAQLDPAVWGAYMKDQEAQYLLALGRYQEVEPACREALAHPACDVRVRVEAWFTLARLCAAQHRLDESASYTEKALDIAARTCYERLVRKIEKFQKALRSREEVPES